MTPDQLAKLRALAQGATPGPWRWGDWRTTFGLLESEFRLTLERNLTYGAATECVPRNRGDGCHLVLQVQDEIDPNNATFIAAASPDVVLALLDALEDNASASGPAYSGSIDLLEHHLSELARVQAERDSFAKLAMERYDDLEALHAELGQTYQSVTVQNLRAERDALAQECSRMKPVYEAAKEWKRIADDPGAPVWKYTMLLDAAIDAALASEHKP